MGWGIPDLPTWRSLNKHLSPPLRFHDHRKALRRNVDGGSEVVETILRSPMSLRAPHRENTVGPLGRDAHHLDSMPGLTSSIVKQR